jgi:hypothetical protein
MLPKPPSELLQDIHWRVIDVKSMATCISHLTRPSRDPPKAPTTITTPSQHPLPTRRDPSTLPSGEHRGKAGVAAKPLLPRGDMLCMQVARRARGVGPIACSGRGAEYWRSGHAVSNPEGPHRGGGGEGGGGRALEAPYACRPNSAEQSPPWEVVSQRRRDLGGIYAARLRVGTWTWSGTLGGLLYSKSL